MAATTACWPVCHHLHGAVLASVGKLAIKHTWVEIESQCWSRWDKYKDKLFVFPAACLRSPVCRSRKQASVIFNRGASFVVSSSKQLREITRQHTKRVPWPTVRRVCLLFPPIYHHSDLLELGLLGGYKRCIGSVTRADTFTLCRTTMDRVRNLMWKIAPCCFDLDYPQDGKLDTLHDTCAFAERRIDGIEMRAVSIPVTSARPRSAIGQPDLETPVQHSPNNEVVTTAKPDSVTQASKSQSKGSSERQVSDADEITPAPLTDRVIIYQDRHSMYDSISQLRAIREDMFRRLRTPGAVPSNEAAAPGIAANTKRAQSH